MWHELKTITHISKSRCFISVELFSIKLKTECEINRIPVLNSALCLKSREFSFPYFCFLSRISMNVSISFAYFARWCFCLMYSLNLCAGNWRAAGQNWSPRACLTLDRCFHFTLFHPIWKHNWSWCLFYFRRKYSALAILLYGGRLHFPFLCISDF